MHKSKFIKVITLMLFVISLSAFVAYRGGYILLTDSTSATASQEVAQDSIPVKPDSLANKTWMHSSKSVIISMPFKTSDSLRRSKSRKRVFLMSGSKSGSVFALDSTQSDSIKPKPIKRRK